ncbi:hypothetical protein [Ktedonobacter robiniae]|uniref:hypothetical protein n=1 Tax=Ktedonobacter robiniae TaxID=2778365 RepID=UPI00191665F2|nr:hypothetical protein [Ktedonobacter robiniae]
MHSLIVWGMWLLTMAIFFSMANFIHQYYLSTMAPAICALFGIGAVVMWRDYRQSGWRGWLLPVAILLTALEQIHILLSNPGWGSWMLPIIAGVCTLAAVILFIARLLPYIQRRRLGKEEGKPPTGLSRVRFNGRIQIACISGGLIALLLVSAVWSATPVLAGTSLELPVAGPNQRGNDGSIETDL